MPEKTLADDFLAEARHELAACLARVKHCLGQLDEGQVWRRPRPSMNSVGSLLLHLSGILRRRLGSAAGGTAHEADRAAESAPMAKAELLSRLDETVGEVDSLLAGLTAERLLEPRRYAGPHGELESTVLAVVMRTLLHLHGHVREIVCATQFLLGDAFKFRLPAPASGQIIAADDVVFERGMIPPLPAAPPPAETAPAAGATAGIGPSESAFRDHLLELEQEFQDQEEEGKV